MKIVKRFNKKDIYIVKGEIEFKIIKGLVDIVGKIFSGSEQGYIPKGKSLPFEILEDSEIEFNFFDESKVSKSEIRTIPAEWDELIERIKKEDIKRIIILGAMDTGKSFFATYMANRLIYSGKKVGVIDTDLGQSDIGPPTTIGFCLLKNPILFLQYAELNSFEFVGSHSPSLHLVPMILGFNKITKKALSVSDIVIVNTSGWIFSDGARILKQAKIEIFDPDIIVLLQRENECEALVKSVLLKEKIVRLKVSKKASDTSKAERENLRNLASQNYFKNSILVTLNFNQFETERCYFKTGEILDVPPELEDNIIYIEKFAGPEGALVVSKKPLTKDEIIKLNNYKVFNIKNFIAGNEKGIILGLLNQKRDLLALGILKMIDFKNKIVKIITPLKDNPESIKIIQFGSIKYTDEGRENGFIEPGII